MNMTGLWHGTFAYPAFQRPTTPFVARITDTDGVLAGTIMEPNTMGFTTEELQAVLAGNRQGEAVDFIKTYDGSSDAAHSVDYVGRLSADGNIVTGVWSLCDLDGTFEMRRDAPLEEELAAEAEEELTLSAPPAATVPDPLS